MKPIGIVSIPRHQVPSAQLQFEALFASAGYNTGNLLFTNAVWNQIAGPKEQIGFDFDPEKANSRYRAVVFPAANWFGAHVDFGHMADLVERLDIPAILIGLGTQDASYSGNVDVPEGTVRFTRAVAARSHSISVRGAYTSRILKTYGITNVRVTGCPSLYHGLCPRPDEKLLLSGRQPKAPLLLHSTRFSAGHRPFLETQSLHLDLFRLAYRTRTDLLFQSEPEEISLIVDAAEKPVIGSALKSSMVELYQARSWLSLRRYLLEKGKVFFDLSKGAEALGKYGGVFGTRLHATILALNAGIPAVLAHHDARTQEVCDFANLPAIDASTLINNLDDIGDILSEADFRGFVDARALGQQEYSEFLVDNGLAPIVSLAAQS